MEVTLQAVTTGSVTGNDLICYNQLCRINYLLSAIIFVLLFIWLEKKLKRLTKKFTGGTING